MRLDIRKLLVISAMAVVGAAATPLTRNAKLTTMDAGGDLDRQVRKVVATPATPHWMGWVVPAVEGSGTSCCFSDLGDLGNDNGCCWGCKLEGGNSVIISSGDVVQSRDGKIINLEGSGGYSILLRAASGKINRIRAFSEGCALDAGGLGLTWLENVAQADSLRLLEKLALDPDAVDDDGDRLGESAVMAIAMHADPQADPILARLAGPGHDEDMREQAIFWMGDARGRAGYETLRRIVKDDPDEEFREKAVFALTQSELPEASDFVMSIARGQAIPDLQGKAIEVLGLEENARTASLLREVYTSTTDRPIKRSIMQAYMTSDDTAGLVHVLSTEKDPELRRDAIELLGAQEATDDLVRLYRSESDARNREQILRALGVAEGADELAAVVRAETDPRLRRAAIQSLGIIDGHQSGSLLEHIYATETDREVRSEVLQSFMVQDNSRALIAIARREKDPGLKRKAVEMLSHMEDTAALEFLGEILEQ